MLPTEQSDDEHVRVNAGPRVGNPWPPTDSARKGTYMARRRLAGAAAVAIAIPLLTVITASPAPAAPPDPTGAQPSDVRELTRKDFTLDGKQVEVPGPVHAEREAQRAQAAAATPPVGHRPPVARPATTSTASSTARTTRCAASATRSRCGSPTTPRSPPATAATQIPEHDDGHRRAGRRAWSTSSTPTCIPKETAAFSTPPDRDGTNAILGPDANGNGGDYTGDGDKTVALIDNVRDDNYYDVPGRADLHRRASSPRSSTSCSTATS